MTNKQHAQWGYESRVRKRRDSAPARLKQKLIELLYFFARDSVEEPQQAHRKK